MKQPVYCLVLQWWCVWRYPLKSGRVTRPVITSVPSVVLSLRLKSLVWRYYFPNSHFSTHCCITNHPQALWLLSNPLFLRPLLYHGIPMASGPGAAWKALPGSWLGSWPGWAPPSPRGHRASLFPTASPQSHRQGSLTSCLWLGAHRNSPSGREEAEPVRHCKDKPGLAWWPGVIPVALCWLTPGRPAQCPRGRGEGNEAGLHGDHF